MSYWNKFQTHFHTILEEHSTYLDLIDDIVESPQNILVNCIFGFPLDLFIDEIIKKRFNISTIRKTQSIWNKNIIYNENQYFFEIDLLNPDNPKDLSCISDFILYIIKSRNIGNNKHFIIIKHIEVLSNYFFQFRILLERYSHNAVFLCTTHSISKIETPIKSRFNIFRVPLFTHRQIQEIFKKYLSTSVNNYLEEKESRDIIKAIFLADVKAQEPMLLTKVFCIYNFPPFYDFMKSFDKTQDNLENIRNIAYKCCQYNISILHLVEDFLNIIDDNELKCIEKLFSRIPKKSYNTIKDNFKMKIVMTATKIDNILCSTNKGREPIHIESFLCQLLL